MTHDSALIWALYTESKISVIDLSNGSNDIADVYSYDDNTFYTFPVKDIISQVEGRTPIIIPINRVWGGEETSPGFSEDRISAADTTYPIILDDYTEGEGFYGGLVDGRHRMIKLRRSGARNIQVIKLTPADISQLVQSHANR